jgi:hypothetical protein
VTRIVVTVSATIFVVKPFLAKGIPYTLWVMTFLNRQRVYGVAMGDETLQRVNLGQF